MRLFLTWIAMVLVLLAVFVAAAAEPARFNCRVEGGRLQGCPPVIRVVRGAAVEIGWSTDAPLALHLHGYDLTARPAPGAPAAMAFTAGLAGRFALEIHADATPKPTSRHGPHALLHLEVLPR